MLNINTKDKVSVRLLAFYELILKLSVRTRPYEEMEGETQRVAQTLVKEAKAQVPHMEREPWKSLCQRAVATFEMIPLKHDASKPQIGVVGSAIVGEQAPLRPLVGKLVEAAGCEAVFLGSLDYLIAVKICPITPHGTQKTNSQWEKDLRDARRLQRARWCIYDALHASDRYAEMAKVLYYTEKELANLSFSKINRHCARGTFTQAMRLELLHLFHVQDVQTIMVLSEDKKPISCEDDSRLTQNISARIINVGIEEHEKPAQISLAIAHALDKAQAAGDFYYDPERAKRAEPYAKSHATHLCSAHTQSLGDLTLSPSQKAKIEEAKKRHYKREQENECA